jgi:hypothetical protein
MEYQIGLVAVRLNALQQAVTTEYRKRTGRMNGLREKRDGARGWNPTNEMAGESHRLQVERSAGNRQPAQWKNGHADKSREAEEHTTSLGEWCRGVPLVVMHDLAVQHAHERQRQQGEDDTRGDDRVSS